MMLLPLLLAAGCARDMEPYTPASGLVLTVRCEDPDLTKAPETGTEDGETRFNENLIRSVDFFFYRGDNPAVDIDAAYHKRINLEEDPVIHTGGRWEATFTIVLKRAEAEQIFPANNSKATVYAVVNYDGDLISEAEGTSLDKLAATSIVTDFADTERNYIQDHFLMDGKTTVTYDESAGINASGTINVRRFAAKMTTSISVADNVIITHNSVDDPNEVWKPVLHTMRIYLVDGVKNVTLGTQTSAANTSPKFFSYSAEEHRRPFVKDDGTEYIEHTTVGSGVNEKIYYNTYPMYSYPVAWSTGQPDYTQEKLPGQPYLKLELDWRRTEENGYSYDRRKYYYKVILPENSLERNNWYHFNIDISILGSETEEGQTIIQPTCYVLDWQNKSVPIDKYAVISKARYLSVDTGPIKLNNLTEYSIPFLSSHDVKIVEGSQTARRPYYGENPSEGYSTKYHAWVKNIGGAYYLEYNGKDGDGKPVSGPSNWLTETPTSIEFSHTLVNKYTADDFDYSPYTIEFDIVHKDLTPGVYPYDEYKKHIIIIQYPAIYIDSCPNSDKDIRATSNDNGKPYYHSENDPDKPWLTYPWGYVYIDGGRFIRYGKDAQGRPVSSDPYTKLSTDHNKQEYQWRTVWYTGGGRDIFRINVTVLPTDSQFVIGDPRIDGYDTTVPVLGYSFTKDDKKPGDAVLENRPPTGWGFDYSNFHSAPVVNGDVNTPMKLTGETRPLRYYRPTEDSDRTKNMLAPGYRISTKLGGTEFGNLDKNHAMWRCAGYQEDGFPGGRWRIPTMSEIRFIAQLSAKGVFEPMFKGDYWSANGVVNVNQSSGTVTSNDHATTALLRCVYDAWYWGDEQWGETHDQFVWGDREP